MPGERLDILAAAPLPYRVDGRREFQLGGGLYCATLLAGLASLGHRVRALASGPPPRGAELPEPIGPGVDVRWFALGFVPASAAPSEAFVAAERARFEALLDRCLDERRPDVVLLGSEAQAWYAVDACRRRSLPTLLVSHGVPTAALHRGIYPPAAVRELIGHLQGVDRVVTVARHLELILRSFGVTSVTTVETGVDTSLFRPRPKDPALLRAYGIEPEQVVVGSFSHHRAEKRMPDVIASAELVLASEPGVVYLVLGEGPCYRETVELVERKDIGDRCRFLGELDHAAVPEHMALSDVVVLASEREGCSLVCREAQASGRPLLVSDIDAAREAVGEGTGLLFRLGDVDDLASKTLQLVRDAPLRRRLGANGRAAALSHGRDRWLARCSEALVETARLAA